MASKSRAPSPRTKVRRQPVRASYERASIEEILDQALVSHLAFLDDGQPYAIPTLHALVGESIYFHGSAAGRALRTLATGAPACLTATLIDGLVLARSAFHHSVNYRSAVVLGSAQLVRDGDESLAALQAFTERLVPGRWGEVRPPTAKELRATSVLRMSLSESSAKIRTGPPLDDEQDYELDVWAGTIPLSSHAGEPISDPRLREGVETSAAARAWSQRRA